MPLKKIEVGLTNEIKEEMDTLVEEGFYKNSDTLVSTALRQLIEEKQYALSLRQKAFSKKY